MNRDISFLRENLIAHRGFHNIQDGVPENSILAFKRAIKKKYIIELDVHLLSDGEVVVFHDDNLKRMTGINRLIKDMDYQNIKKLKLLNTDQGIPRLRDVLKLVNGNVPIIIELKYDNKVGLLEDKVMEILKDYHGKYAVKSFHPLSVYYFKRHYPNVIRGQLVDDFKSKRKYKYKFLVLGKIIFNVFTKPDFISCDVRDFPNKRIEKFRNKKLVLGWTVRNEDDMNKAKKYCDNYICENIDNLKV